jgi:spore maturation protein A
MLGKCFSLLCIISFIYGAFTNNMSSVCDGILSGAERGVSICISLIGIMSLWNGILSVFKKAGVIRLLSKILTPILKLIFPSSFKENTATEEITACVSANLLGISNASTPLAIETISKMQEGRNSDTATNDMITLSVLGCACFNIVPTTVIALRAANGAQITYGIIVPVWICSGICCILGVVLCRLFGKINGDY